ncbi:uncharacterized protein [Diadema setosum]|uniref:uncharacterized protein n=1 Tax=Diadema setosum TaxID=31175 RepID=UPI003B3A63BD
MAANDDVIAGYLECPVCLETFEDARDLKCRHTLCVKCIQNLASGGNKITCPVCRQVTIIDGYYGISMLKPNYLVNKMAEALKQKNITTNYKSTNEKEPVCEKHRPVRKKHFCEECKEFICSECALENHKKHASKVSSVKKIVSARTQEMKQILCDSKTKQRQHKEIIFGLQKKYSTGKSEESIKESKSEFDESISTLSTQLQEWNGQMQTMMDVETKKSVAFSKSLKRGRDMLARCNEVEIITNFRQWSDEMKANDLRVSANPSMDRESKAMKDTARTCLIHLRKLEEVLSELQANDTSSSGVPNDASGEGLQKAGPSTLKKRRLNVSQPLARNNDEEQHGNDTSRSGAPDDGNGKDSQKAGPSTLKKWHTVFSQSSASSIDKGIGYSVLSPDSFQENP